MHDYIRAERVQNRHWCHRAQSLRRNGTCGSDRHRRLSFLLDCRQRRTQEAGRYNGAIAHIRLT
jgi:hypothetical protein